MGLSNRDYFQDEDPYGYGGGPTGPSGPMSATTIVTIAIGVSYLVTTLMGPGAELLRLTRTDVLSGKVWQVLTYGFTADPGGTQFLWVFLFIALFFFSLSSHMVEPLIGRVEYLWLYGASILAGGISSSLVPGNPLFNHAGPLVAPHAIVLWAVMKFPRHIVHLFGVIPIPLWVIGAVDVLMAVWPTVQSAGQGQFVLFPAVAAMAVAATHQRLGWRFTTLRQSLGRLKSRPKLKVYAPEAASAKKDDLAEKVDEILAKISREGEASLTSKERKILKQASEKYKGRV